jgi:hypothetical protein
MAKFKDVVGLVVLFIVILAVCAVGFVAYSIANDVAAKTREKMEKKNIKVSRDGLKVVLKQISSEQVADSTQGSAFSKYEHCHVIDIFPQDIDEDLEPGVVARI